jgi:hypothetical protein
MTREEVISMLGPPEERSREGQLAYALGTSRGVDPELLIVRYDRDGIVLTCFIMTT